MKLKLEMSKNKPWGTNAQFRDSTDKLDINLAEDTALCNGIIDSIQLNCNGNLTTPNQQFI